MCACWSWLGGKTPRNKPAPPQKTAILALSQASSRGFPHRENHPDETWRGASRRPTISSTGSRRQMLYSFTLDQASAFVFSLCVCIVIGWGRGRPPLCAPTALLEIIPHLISKSNSLLPPWGRQSPVDRSIHVCVPCPAVGHAPFPRSRGWCHAPPPGMPTWRPLGAGGTRIRLCGTTQPGTRKALADLPPAILTLTLPLRPHTSTHAHTGTGTFASSSIASQYHHTPRCRRPGDPGPFCWA